jgi:hypothetical protein
MLFLDYASMAESVSQASGPGINVSTNVAVTNTQMVMKRLSITKTRKRSFKGTVGIERSFEKTNFINLLVCAISRKRRMSPQVSNRFLSLLVLQTVSQLKPVVAICEISLSGLSNRLNRLLIQRFRSNDGKRICSESQEAVAAASREKPQPPGMVHL